MKHFGGNKEVPGSQVIPYAPDWDRTHVYMVTDHLHGTHPLRYVCVFVDIKVQISRTYPYMEFRTTEACAQK